MGGLFLWLTRSLYARFSVTAMDKSASFSAGGCNLIFARYNPNHPQEMTSFCRFSSAAVWRDRLRKDKEANHALVRDSFIRVEWQVERSRRTEGSAFRGSHPYSVA
jgi:hypothetical protein